MVLAPSPAHLFLGLRSRAGIGALVGALAPLLAKLKFIYGPHCSLLALHSHKALVQAQVVADGILPGGGVVSEVGEHASKPMVDFIECPLPLRGFQDGLEVGVRWNKGHVPQGCG